MNVPAIRATFSFQHRESGGIQEGSRFERSWSPPLGDKGWGGIGFQQLLRIVSPRDCRREDSAAGSGSRGVMDATIQIPRSWNLISRRRRRRRRNGYFELLGKMARRELIVSRVMRIQLAKLNNGWIEGGVWIISSIMIFRIYETRIQIDRKF